LYDGVKSTPSLNKLIANLNIVGTKNRNGSCVRLKECENVWVALCNLTPTPKKKIEQGGCVSVDADSENCRITSNDFNGINNSNVQRGGGLAVTDSDDILVDHNRFLRTNAEIGGGGAFAEESENLLIQRNTFLLCEAENYGGGIGLRGTTVSDIVTIRFNLLCGNIAESGGGIGIVGEDESQFVPPPPSTIAGAIDFLSRFTALSTTGVTATIDNNCIFLNKSVIRPPSKFTGGGGIYITPEDSDDSMILNNQIIGNSSARDGGGIMFTNLILRGVLAQGNNISLNTAEDDAGGIYVTVFSGATLVENEILGNQARNEGGGIHVTGGSRVIMTKNSVSQNSAPANGGGISLRNSRVDSISDFVVGNSTDGDGAGIYLAGKETGVGNAIFRSIPPYFKGEDLFVASNTAGGRGGGLAVFRQTTTVAGIPRNFQLAYVTVCDSFFANNTGAPVFGAANANQIWVFGIQDTSVLTFYTGSTPVSIFPPISSLINARLNLLDYFEGLTSGSAPIPKITPLIKNNALLGGLSSFLIQSTTVRVEDGSNTFLNPGDQLVTDILYPP